MTEPLKYEFKCMGSCIIPYIDQINYEFANRKNYNKIGYIKPKEIFEEWFKYITSIKFFSKVGTDNGLDLSDILYHQEGDGIISSKIYDNVLDKFDTVFFEFPDEEMALYFKLKFIKE